MAHAKTLTVSGYFNILTRMLGQPRAFFRELPENFHWKKALGFLLVSSFLFAGASVLGVLSGNRWILGGIFWINAVGMTLICAAVGYGVMVMIWGKRVRFPRFFSVYALSAGVTLLAAWIPFFVWLTEPWKWWLIGTGMTEALGFSWMQAAMIIVVSVGIVVLFFFSLWPVLSPGK